MKSAELSRLEEIIDASAASARIEALLPVGVRRRQLQVRTLLLGMLICAAQGAPAHLARVHRALSGLREADKRRLGVIALWKSQEHELSYRQTEYTFALVVAALAKDKPDGEPSEILSEILDALLRASIDLLGVPNSSSLAIDWTDLESWARPPRKSRGTQQDDAGAADTENVLQDDAKPTPGALPGAGAEHEALQEQRRCADREAAFGHRNTNTPAKAQSFFGYYLQAVTIVAEEHGPAVPELVRAIHIASPKHDPPAQIVPVIERMRGQGMAIGDVVVDSGYSYREPGTFAAPLRAIGAELVMDLHPGDRGMKGTHMGAIVARGNLYCPATPRALLELSPLPPGAGTEQTEEHDHKCSELKRYKLSAITSPDSDGYRRVICPAVAGKLRCPLREASLGLSHERPTILAPPEQPPICCSQKTITVPASVNAKSAQKHDYPSAEHRRSYARRSAAERTNATVNDTATNNLARGWCRLMGLTRVALFAATVFVARNIRIADAFAARQADGERRAACGLEPRRRRRRREPLPEPSAKANAPPALAA